MLASPAAHVEAPHVEAAHVEAAHVEAARVEAARVEEACDDGELAPATMRCESCGGPAGDGNLCLICQRAFHELLDNKWLGSSSLEAEGPDSDDSVAETGLPADLASVSALFDETVAASSGDPGSSEHWTLTAQVAHDMERGHAESETEPRLASTAGHGTSGQLRLAFESTPEGAVAPQSSRTGVVVPMPSTVFAEAAARMKPPSTSVEHQAAASARSASPVGNRSMLTAAAALVVVAAIGFPLATMLRGGSPSPGPVGADVRPETPIRQEPPRAAAKAPAPERQTPSAAVTSPVPEARAAVTPAAKPAMATRSVPTRSQPSATMPRRASGTTPATTRTRPSAPPSAPVAAPSPAIVAPAAEVAAPAPEAVAPAPPPEPPAAPSGPFYEMRDVSQTPQVVNRVEPQVPDALRGPVNEIVVVRVLVSQAGRPSLIRLLRGSRTGPVLDAAVVAAVSQWAFVPARRHGEAVSCWYHIGVPVRRID